MSGEASSQSAPLGAWQQHSPPLGMDFGRGPVDPYLVWFEYTGYAGVNPSYTKLPVMVQLRKRWKVLTELEKRVLNALLVDGLPVIDESCFLNRFIARKHLAALVFLQALRLVRRFQLAAPRGNPIPPRQQDVEVQGPPGGHVYGVIDDACCVANTRHWSVAANGGVDSRILWLWDQDSRANVTSVWIDPKSGEPDSPGYGLQTHLLRLGKSLERLVGPHRVSERDYYGEILGRERWGRIGRTHGASVLNCLTAEDPQTPIVFVQLPETTVGDASGGSLGFYVVDGARYIVERVRTTGVWSTTINISVGSIAGPHDGSSITERALDELATSDENNGHVQIVVAAGNTSGRGVHAKHDVDRDRAGVFEWLVRPGNLDETYLEVWFPPNCGDLLEGSVFSLEIQPPGEPSSPAFALGMAHCLSDSRAQVIAGVVFAARVSQGERGTMALIALRPTERRIGSDASLAPAGIWRVTVKSTAEKPATVHAWVERNEIIIGRRSGQRTRLVGAGVCDDHTLGSICHGSRTLAVGGYTVRTRRESEYSALGPVRDSGASKPEQFGPSDKSAWIPGVQVAGFFSGTLARLSGTSAAAPRVARWIADARPSKEVISITRRDGSPVDAVMPRDEK